MNVAFFSYYSGIARVVFSTMFWWMKWTTFLSQRWQISLSFLVLFMLFCFAHFIFQLQWSCEAVSSPKTIVSLHQRSILFKLEMVFWLRLIAESIFSLLCTAHEPFWDGFDIEKRQSIMQTWPNSIHYWLYCTLEYASDRRPQSML